MTRQPPTHPRLLLRLLTCGLVLACSAATSCAAPDGPSHLRAISVETLTFDERTETPVILLRESDGDARELPIWIGMPEARSIAMALEDVPLPRPNTHDLIKNILDGLEGHVLRVVITELRGHTYYAQMDVRLNGRVVTVDSRPSDAIAVAIRTGAPLFADEGVLDHDSELEQGEPPLDIRGDPDTHPSSPSEPVREL